MFDGVENWLLHIFGELQAELYGSMIEFYSSIIVGEVCVYAVVCLQ